MNGAVDGAVPRRGAANERRSGEDLDRAIVRAAQAGLPRVPRPYHAIAETIGVAPEVVLERMRAMLASGAIRRIGVVPNHYRLGWTANGMTVWDVDDARVDELGVRIGALPGVSHCYRRPRRLPAWRYNLFAMVHGRDRAECESQDARDRRAARRRGPRARCPLQHQGLEEDGVAIRVAGFGSGSMPGRQSRG